MSHIKGFNSAAFPAWWKLSLWVFSPSLLPKEPNPEVWGWCYQLLHHAIQSILCPAASPNPLQFHALCWAAQSPVREGGSVLQGVLVQPISLGNRVLAGAKQRVLGWVAIPERSCMDTVRPWASGRRPVVLAPLRFSSQANGEPKF